MGRWMKPPSVTAGAGNSPSASRTLASASCSLQRSGHTIKLGAELQGAPRQDAAYKRSPGGPGAWTAFTCNANRAVRTRPALTNPRAWTAFSCQPDTPPTDHTGRADSTLRLAKALRALLAASLAALSICAVCASFAPNAAHAASTGTPWWHVNFTSSPTLLPRSGTGRAGEGLITVKAVNVGDGEVRGEQEPVLITDKLPAGVTAEVVTPRDGGDEEGMTTPPECSGVHTQIVRCEFKKNLASFRTDVMRIVVHMNVTDPTLSSLPNVVTVEGGEATPVNFGEGGEKLLELGHVNGEATPFGVESYELAPEGEAGSLDSQAGSHPFQLTTQLDLNTALDYYATASVSNSPGWFPSAPALPQNLHFKLPPGLVADTTAVPRCSMVAFSTISGPTNLCPADTAIGVAVPNINLPNALRSFETAVPVFNLTPSPGEPARFGFEVEKALVVLKTSLPAGGDYAAEVATYNTTELAQILSSLVTIWGVPGDPRHDFARGWDCLEKVPSAGELAEAEQLCSVHESEPSALLTLPSSCTTLESSVWGNSWPTGEQGNDGSVIPAEHTNYRSPAALTGCGALGFDPSLSITPEQHAASTPTGLNVAVAMPQEGLTAAGGLAESALRETTVALPQGMQLNPSAANGLEACSALDFGSLSASEADGGHLLSGSEEELQTADEHFTTGPPDCPDAAKVGTVNISTPLLEHEVTGSVYLAAQNTDPFRAPLALYLVAEDPAQGILVKLAGEVTVDEATGQITTTFRNTPQLPFSDLRLHLFGGQRASLSTPALCGPYAASSEFVPWSGAPPATPAAGFTISSGPGGGPCQPSPLSFAPSVTAGTSTAQAGAFSSFTIQIARPDGQQQLTGITVHMPPGIAGLLAKLTPCPEPPAGQEWSCGPASLIGDTTAVAGLGSEPFTLPGKAYLTTGYDRAPFGVLVQTPAIAGPFNLGMVNVRSKIEVNPETADVTITTDPGPRGEGIPSRLKGVPAQLQRVVVNVDRPEFLFNPTDCAPFTITGSLAGDEGASSSFSYPFQVSNCATLPFHPTLTASAGGRASKANGTSFVVNVTSQGLGVANIAKVDLQLPEQLPSRLTTIQKACLAAVFAANPASCDEGSVIGYATIHTPVFKNPLSGPAYLVSHGGAAFPDVEFVLQGEGVTIVLDGKTQITKGITYSKFESAPDAPFTSFETVLPAGPHSALTANVPENKKYDLCGEKLSMPTTITAQNGAVIEQNTKIAIGGCGAVKAYKVTLAQQLAKALRKCRSTFKHSASKRTACERKARAKYTAMAMAACRRSDKHSSKKLKACEVAARKAYAAKATRRGKR